MESEIVNFFLVRIGAAVLLIVVALLVSWRKSRRRAMMTNPHRDHIYHYTSPHITDVPADYYPHRHHRSRPSDPEE